MKCLEPQHMLGLRVMSKKGLDAYSGYNQISEHIVIKDNKVDYSKAKNTACYGIRICGANDVSITDNCITGNVSSRIAIEAIPAKDNQWKGLLNEGMLVPSNILIEGNDVNGVWVAGYAKYKIRNIKVANTHIHGDISLTNQDIIFKNNIIEKTATVHAAPTPQANIFK